LREPVCHKGAFKGRPGPDLAEASHHGQQATCLNGLQHSPDHDLPPCAGKRHGTLDLVASSDFQPDRYNLEEILTRRYYHIPRFQRPYSWDPANLEDFWRDVFEDNDAGYFIGPMVGWRKKDAPHANVVDGQQRLTTITILLTVIRDAFAAFGEAKLADGVHGYIEREDRNNDPYFVLQPEDKAPYLNNGVLKHPRDETAQPSTYNERNLATARAWLAAKVQESLVLR